jgi:hypothetical protein
MSRVQYIKAHGKIWKVRIANLHEPEPNEWRGRTISEKIHAMDILRLQWHRIKGDNPHRLQKVYRITKRRTS